MLYTPSLRQIELVRHRKRERMRKSGGEKEREWERGIGGAQGERLHGGGSD